MTGGYKIDVRGTALEVLHRMDAHDAVLAASTQMQGAKLVDRDGNVIGELSGDQFGTASAMTSRSCAAPCARS